MIVRPYKTHKITAGEDLFAILDKYLPALTEKSIVVITSKIISICQNNVLKNDGTIDKKALIKTEADRYFEDENLTRYGTVIPTIKDAILIANAGIDESNSNGDFVLWPKDIAHTTEQLWNYLKKKHSLKELGILITDSRTTPLRWGVSGVGISWCGFAALKDYRGKSDIFGRTLRMSQESIIDGLAASAVVVMGEGDEQTPLSVITDIPFATFQDYPPTPEERALMHIELQDDIYGKFLTSVEWKKGGKKE